MPSGGSQSTGGSGIYNSSCSSGSFGQGSSDVEQVNERINQTIPGGGGGFYGGASCRWIGASGGSGYIGNSLLTNKHMTCYNCEPSDDENTKTISNECHNTEPTEDCAKEGNGYARITLLNITE